MKELTSEEKKEIRSFWRQYSKRCNKLYNINQYNIYNRYKQDGESLIDYFPDDFYYCYIDDYLTNYHSSIKVDNKNMYELYFHDINKPLCVIRKLNGVLLDADYNAINIDQAIELCKKHQSVVIKKAINSDGGHGIQFVKDCPNNQDKLKELLTTNNDFIAQTIIQQHEILAKFNPQSVNTIRIMTIVLNGKATFVSSVLRMGANGAVVDNASSDGVFCGINNEGYLKDRAYDAYGNIYYKHPQGQSFENTQIPSFDKCVEIAKKLSLRFLNYTRLISWDFSISKEGEPILVEANLTGGGINMHQMCNGPIFKPFKKEILDEVFSKSKNLRKRL